MNLHFPLPKIRTICRVNIYTTSDFVNSINFIIVFLACAYCISLHYKQRVIIKSRYTFTFNHFLSSNTIHLFFSKTTSVHIFRIPELCLYWASFAALLHCSSLYFHSYCRVLATCNQNVFEKWFLCCFLVGTMFPAVVSTQLAMSLHFPLPKIRTFRFSLHTSRLSLRGEVTMVALKFAMSSHFPLPKIFSPSGFLPPLSNGTSRATSDRKPKTNDQILPSPIFLPIEKMNQINTKNYWK